METNFIPYNQRLALKKLGFCESCFGYYYTINGKDWQFAEKNEYYILDDEINIGPRFSLLAPLYQQAYSWLYQKLDIEKGLMPLDTESQQLLLKELIEKVSSKYLLV